MLYNNLYSIILFAEAPGRLLGVFEKLGRYSSKAERFLKEETEHDAYAKGNTAGY